MSLTLADLQAIDDLIKRRIEPLENDIKALRADVKKIYNILAKNGIQVV